jgi:lysophospholipase L1-like esterase
MIYKKYLFLVLLFSFSLLCSSQNNELKKSLFYYSGRVELLEEDKIILIGSASSVSFNFKGNFCEILLQSVDDHQNYVSLELDGKYIGRLRIEKGKPKSYSITASETREIHHLSIFKATEAASGDVLFSGTTANLVTIKPEKRKKIEFIGNSITCGAQSDPSDIPCDKGEYIDHHNAYLAYGPVLSRTLKVDFLLSSVSGIGMYRNWNDEHKDEPIMPEVYENLHLNKDTNKRHNFAFQPDVLSICLGTNDMSQGDNIKPRLPFNEDKYVSNYIKFIKMIYVHYPKTKIVLLNSPMVSGDSNVIFVKCLKKVIQSFEGDKIHKPIALFEYKSMTAHGCGGHPDVEDHKIMAEQMNSFFKKLLDEN